MMGVSIIRSIGPCARRFCPGPAFGDAHKRVPYGKISVCVWFVSAVLHAADKDPVVVRHVERGVEVSNGCYSVLLSQPAGYAITSIIDKRTGARYTGSAGLALRKRWERQSQRQEALMPAVEWVAQNAQQCALEVKEQSQETARLVVRWSAEAAEVIEDLAFARASRAVEVGYVIRVKRPLDLARFGVDFRDLGPRSSFYPDGARVSASVGGGKRRPAPALVYAFDPDTKSGLGLSARATPSSIAPELATYTTHVAGTVTYGFTGTPEGYGGNGERVNMAYSSRVLTWDAVGTEHHLQVRLIVGGDLVAVKAEEADLAQSLPAGSAALVSIEKARPRKLIFRRQEPGQAAVVLLNRTQEKRSPQLVCELARGFDECKQVSKARVPLKPKERKEVEVTWPAVAREYGYEFRARIGQESKSDYFAVADQSSKVAQMTVANPGWFNRSGMERWLIPALRDSYVGIMEYYCWAPSALYELTPDAEQFNPHTESNAGAYRATLTRTFLKDMIASAHGEGLRVVAELSPFASLPTALQHPEEVIYTEDGHPYVFNRKVFEAMDEYAVAAVNYYTPERVERWADEMSASVRMFGWDGVRFDCGWIPSFGNPDPLRAAEKREYLSHDHEGRVLHVEDPDGVGEQLAHVWRTSMTRKCPDFEYMSNHSQPANEQQKYPKTNRAMAENDGGLLQEDRLGVNLPEMHTWELWAAALRNNGEGVRANGGHPMVGWMLGGPAVSTRVRHYVAFASGYRMYGSGGTGDVEDPTPEDYRFALRFSEYLYDSGLRWLPLDQQKVQVVPDDRILWKPFVYQRALGKKGTEIVVDLVNLPASDEVLWQHDPPTTRRNVQVTIAVPSNYRFESGWMLVPEPQPRAVKLPAQVEGERVVMTAPEVVGMAIVVGRFLRAK